MAESGEERAELLYEPTHLHGMRRESFAHRHIVVGGTRRGRRDHEELLTDALLDVVGIDHMHADGLQEGEELTLLSATLSTTRAEEEDLSLGLQEDLSRCRLAPRDIDAAVPDTGFGEKCLDLISDIRTIEEG